MRFALLFPLLVSITAVAQDYPKTIYYGSAWYPEHWPEERWSKDIELMKELKFNVVRVGEFAWSKMEPSEGNYQLDWLEKAIDLAWKNGIPTVIGTPTAAPPIWMIEKYPEVRRVNEGGSIAPHGLRGHYNPASEKYLDFCAKIAEALGKRFGNHPGVIGWQIDNEYWPFSFDKESQKKFQSYLKNRYKTIENLNQKWGAAYWSQEYFSWDQIPLLTKNQNPCMVLEVARFKSIIQNQYQDKQVNVLRKSINKKQFITTNFHGEFNHNDAGELGKSLDFMSFDPYVGTGHLDYNEMGFRLDRLRGFKNKPFWIMETQPAHVNWSWVNNELDPNETRRMIWHQIAHGGDAVLYWQWRSCIGGQEQYHGALLGQSGNLKPFTKEVKQAGEEFSKVAPLLNGSLPKSKVAVWFPLEDQWAIKNQKHHKEYDPVKVAKKWYSAVRSWGVDVDVIADAKKLSEYDIVFAPNKYIISEDHVSQIKNALSKGVHIILGPRSGRKNIYNGLITEYQPALGLSTLLGAVIEEFYALEEKIGYDGELKGKGKLWAEYLTIKNKNTKIISKFNSNPWLNGRPAIVSNKVNKGTLAYVGVLPDEGIEDVVGYFMKNKLGEKALQKLPKGLELCRRESEKGSFAILINHTKSPIDYTITGLDLITDQKIKGKATIPANDVMVIKE